MNLDPYVSLSGRGGLYRLVTNRSNGLILEDIETGKSGFFSTRKYQFTPLGTVAIYTLTDTVALTEVFERMRDKEKETPPVDVKAETYKIEQYFESIVPDYDEDRVSVNDMKKVIRWYSFLKDRDLLKDEEE